MLEKQIKAQIIAYLRILEMKGKLRFYSLFTGPRITGRGNNKVFLKNPASGISDLVILPKDKMAIWVELKTKTGRQSLAQIIFQQTVSGMGHPYVIWRSLEDAQNYFEHA